MVGAEFEVRPRACPNFARMISPSGEADDRQHDHLTWKEVGASRVSPKSARPALLSFGRHHPEREEVLTNHFTTFGRRHSRDRGLPGIRVDCSQNI
jgi:hypothetical protein